MAWAVAAIVGIAVALPLGAWLMTRRRAKGPPPLSYPERVCAWLRQNCGLSEPQQAEVEFAVKNGRKVSDPALEAAAHALAAEILSGGLPGPRLQRLRGWLALGFGAALVSLPIALMVGNQPDQNLPAGWGSGGGTLVVGSMCMYYAVKGLILGPWRRRRAAAQALKLNQAPPGRAAEPVI